MRADRLVAILMLLQTRGKVTAAEVARELEVSERTARRDLEALGLAGLPVYSVAGRDGGWRLAGAGRTDLSGLSAAEARALFLLVGPAEATPELKAALRKLMRALPEPLRAGASAASAAVVTDPSGWDGEAARAVPVWLDTVQRAVIDGEQLDLDYTARDGTASQRRVHPLGLAAKGRSWYLVADTAKGLRTFRIDRIASAGRTGDPVVRPDAFDLQSAWASISDRVEALRSPFVAHATAEPTIVGIVRYVLGTRVSIGPAGADGRIQLELRGHHARGLAGEIAGFGAALSVTEPEELRTELARIGAELAAHYGTP